MALFPFLYMTDQISKLIADLHRSDQKRRRQIIKDQGTKKLSQAKNKLVFYEFKGECQEKTRIIRYLAKQHLLTEPNDYYLAASILINNSNLDDLILAYKFIKQYRALGGRKNWALFDSFFTRQAWGISREEAEKIIEKKIGVSPKDLDKFLPRHKPYVRNYAHQ